MKTIALVLLLGLGGAAGAGYKEAGEAVKNLDAAQAKELDTFLAQPGAALAKNARVTGLLNDNGPAMELFRRAAGEANDGYLFAPKPEKLNRKTPVPVFGAHIKLLKLILIDAKIKAVQRQPVQAERDLLAAAAFMAQLSEQKSANLISSVVEQLCLMKAYPVIAESLRNPSASAGYLKGLAALLYRAGKSQDFMRAAMLQEIEVAKGSVRENVTPEAAALERKKVPFWKRAVAAKLQDAEFFSLVYKKCDAALDERAKAMAEAFRANAPAIADDFIKKQVQELEARKEASLKWGFWAQFKDGLTGGKETRERMAEVMADVLLCIPAPNYGKLVPRYHLYYSQLNVLKSALAVKLYQRAGKRLPNSLEQLVPGYLAAVPQYPFNKFAPVIYVRTGKKFLVYAFGPDGKDGGGAAALDPEAYFEDPARDAGDIVFAD